MAKAEAMGIVVTVRDPWYGNDDFGVVIDKAQVERLKKIRRVFEYRELGSSDELASDLDECRAQVMLSF